MPQNRRGGKHREHPRLWDAFALPDDQLAGALGDRVHPAARQWLASWHESQGEG